MGWYFIGAAIMKLVEVTVVRIYLNESKHLLKPMMERLHNEEKVRGVTVFRGLEGFGASGIMHQASLLDLSLDLPLVIEFYDTPATVEQVLDRIGDMIPADHIVCWSAYMPLKTHEQE